MEKTAIRKCPICNNSRVEILHKQNFKLYEGAPIPERYDVICCVKCGFVYADTAGNQEAYDQYYTELSRYEDDSTGTGGGGSEFDLERMVITAKDIASVITSKEASIIDIGCANGGILEILKGYGYKDLTGLDPSPTCVDTLKSKGLKSVLGGLFNIPDSLLVSGKFDCVILSHVFEHIYDLSKAVKVVGEVLKENGILYVEVPDAEEYYKYYVVPYYYFDCEHINHFDQDALKNLCEGSGFTHKQTIKKEMRVSSAHLYPALGQFFTKKPKTPSSLTQSKARKSILKYIEMSKQDGEKKITDISKSQKKVIVWGAGSYTQRLLANTDLGKCNIVAFIDNDKVKQGNKINGIPIVGPENLIKFNYPIMVCSALHNQEIEEEIKSRKFDNKVILVNE